MLAAAASIPTGPPTPLPFFGMATRDQLHREVDAIPDEKLANARLVVDEETEMAPLPEGWGQTLTGEPMPNVAAAVRRSRDSH